METTPLQKQLQMWDRFMYVVLGSSITFLVISFGNFINPSEWSSFANYASEPWMVLELLAMSSGIYLLWHKRWKALPLQSRINTVSGYFIASWFGFVAFGLMIQREFPTESSFLLVCAAVLLPVVYLWASRKRSSPRDEIFP
jgi:hypothetical protein